MLCGFALLRYIKKAVDRKINGFFAFKAGAAKPRTATTESTRFGVALFNQPVRYSERLEYAF